MSADEERCRIIGGKMVGEVCMVDGYPTATGRQIDTPVIHEMTKRDFLHLTSPYIGARKEHYCSEASASMMLKYYDFDISQEVIHNAGYDTFEKMLPFLNKHLTCKQFSASIDDIKSSIMHNHPVMVRILPEGQRDLHTVLIIGVEDDDIVVHDPNLGAYLKVQLSAFQKTWRATNNMAIFCEPKQIKATQFRTTFL